MYPYKKLFLQYFTSVFFFLLVVHLNLNAQQPNTSIAQQYLDSANLMFDSVRYDDALIFGHKALSVFRQTLGEQDTSTANVYYLIGRIWNEKKDLEKALVNHLKALDIRATALGEAHTKVAQSYNEIGHTYHGKGKIDKALMYHLDALKIYLDAFGNEHPSVGFTYRQIGIVYEFNWALDKALEYYEKSLKIYLAAFGKKNARVGDAYLDMGIIYDLKGEWDKALEYQFKALKIYLLVYGKDHPNVGHCYNNIGIIYRIKADYEKALHFHQKALQIRLGVWGKDPHPEVAGSYNNLAALYNKKGDLTKALEHHRKALALRLKIYGENHYKVASSYFNMSTVYYKTNELNKALAFSEKALKMRLAVLGVQHAQVANSYKTIGAIYLKKGKPDKALTYFQKTLGIWQKIHSKTHFNIADSFHDFAVVYRKKGAFDKALDYHEKALKIRQAAFGQKHPKVADSMKGIGLIYAKKGIPDKALEFLSKAQEIRLEILGPDHPEVADIYDAISQVYYLKKDYELAIDYSEKAISNLENIRKRYQSSETKQIHLSNYYYIYENAIVTTIAAVEAHPGKYDLQKAFIYSEKAKSKLLLEALHGTHARSFAGIPASLLQKEYDLNIELTYYDKKRFEEQQKGKSKNDSLLSAYNNKLFDLNRVYEELISQFEQDYPDYYHLKYETKVVSVRDIRDVLEDDQALIEYFVGDSVIFVFIISKQDYQIEKIEKDFLLEEWIRQMRQGIYQYHLMPHTTQSDYTVYNDTFAQVSFKLYEKLIAPIKSNLTKKLIIVPDGLLGYFPFDALLMEKPRQNRNFKTHAYLVRDHQISYCYSATLLEEMQQSKKGKTSKGLLAFAPSFKNDAPVLAIVKASRQGLGTLNYNIPEVIGIQNIYGGDIHTGFEATKSHFIAISHQYNILHLATHGKANNIAGDYSYLAFTHNRDSTNDNKLYVRELYNLKLNADLVVLSACETGVGELQHGEGIISLARGFSYAGARSIVSTLWPVNDASTKELMQGFYTHLKTGLTKDAALRQAKLDYLADHTNDEAHPFYWAGFIPIGNMNAIAPSRGFWWVWVLAIGIFATFFYGRQG